MLAGRVIGFADTPECIDFAAAVDHAMRAIDTLVQQPELPLSSGRATRLSALLRSQAGHLIAAYQLVDGRLHDRSMIRARRPIPGGGVALSCSAEEKRICPSDRFPIPPRRRHAPNHARFLRFLRSPYVQDVHAVCPARPRAPAVAQAQDNPVQVNFGGGVAFPVGDVADSFDTGWNFSTGLTFNANEASASGRVPVPSLWRPGPVVRRREHDAAGRRPDPDPEQPPDERGRLQRRAESRRHEWHAGVRPGRSGRLLAQGAADHAQRRVHHRVRSLLVRVLPVARRDRRHHRRPDLDRLRHQRRRRRQLRCLLRRGPLSLRVGRRCARAGGGQTYGTNASYFPITFGFRF